MLIFITVEEGFVVFSAKFINKLPRLTNVPAKCVHSKIPTNLISKCVTNLLKANHAWFLDLYMPDELLPFSRHPKHELGASEKISEKY